MTGVLGRWVEDFKKGRDAAYAERGTARHPVSSEGETEVDPDETRKLLAEVTELAEQLQTRVTELETERDEAKTALAEATATAEPLQQRSSELDAELTEKKKLIEDMAGQLEALQKRIEEVEGERDLFAEVLQTPGFRKVLLKVVLPDAHPDADDEQRRLLTLWSSKLNAAYELLGRKEAAP